MLRVFGHICVRECVRLSVSVDGCWWVKEREREVGTLRGGGNRSTWVCGGVGGCG